MASNESQTQKLIGLYRSCECLWNPQSPGYLSGTVQDDAWRKITRGMNSGLTPDQVKLQILALRNYYDAECAAIRQSKLEGYSYEPRHSYFKDMLFLGKVLPEETEESKANFCLGQLNGILEDSLIREDYHLSNYPKHFSEATFSQDTASLCNRTNDIKPDYTFYKLILEPEEPSNSREREDGASIEKNSEREVSGNDNTRFYPTAYCVPCKRKKPSCVQRCECTDTESDSSCGCYNPCRPKCVYAQRCGSRTSIGSCQRQFASPGCGSPPIVYNKHRCRYEEPGPKLCCQPRPRYVPKCPPVDVGRDRSCCVNSWKRNNKAVRRRLKAQLEAREARNQACCFSSQGHQRLRIPMHDVRDDPCCCSSHNMTRTLTAQCAGQEAPTHQPCCCSLEGENDQCGAQGARNQPCRSNSQGRLNNQCGSQESRKQPPGCSSHGRQRVRITTQETRNQTSCCNSQDQNAQCPGQEARNQTCGCNSQDQNVQFVAQQARNQTCGCNSQDQNVQYVAQQARIQTCGCNSQEQNNQCAAQQAHNQPLCCNSHGCQRVRISAHEAPNQACCCSLQEQNVQYIAQEARNQTCGCNSQDQNVQFVAQEARNQGCCCNSQEQTVQFVAQEARNCGCNDQCDAQQAHNQPLCSKSHGRHRSRKTAQEARNQTCGCNSQEQNVQFVAQEARNQGCGCNSQDQNVQFVAQEARIQTCGCNSQEQNNQYAAQEAQIQSCGCNPQEQTVPCDAQEPWNPTCCTSSKERRRSGQDQMNAYSQNGIPQMNNYQQPICAPCMNNNHQDMDYGRYNQQGQEPSSYYDNQQMPDSHPCINNQQMQDSGRYNNNPQGQQLYSNATYYQAQATKTAYYQPQQQLPQSQQQPSILTRPAQQYGNTNYAPYQPGIDYGRSATSDQSNAYGYAVDNNCGQTPAPAQRPLTCLPCSQDGQNCQVPSSRPPDMDNRYLADTCRYSEQPPGIGQQEDDCRCGSVTKRDRQWQPDDVLRNNQPRRCNQNQGRYDDDEQDPQRRRPNDFDQDGDQRPLVTRRIDRVECITRVRSYEYVEDSGRGRGCYDQSPTRGDPRNNVPDRNYEECPAARKQYMAEREVYCPDRNYENCPSPIRRRPDDCDDYPETPSRRVPDMQEPRRMDQTIFSRKPPPECHKKSKRKEYMECKNPDCQATNSPPKNSNYVPEPRACPQPANDLEYVPCPCPPSRQIPRASPYYSQPERVRQDREDRICGKTRPPPRKCDYEDDRRPPTRDTNRSPPEETECECECESEEERIPPPKRRTRDNRSRRPCDDTDNTYGSGPKNRQERGKENREVFEACCTDETCPYYSEIPPCQEPSASPKRKSKKCYDDERPAKNVCRNQSPTRKSPRQRDDTTDCESPKKSLKKMKAPMDCDDCECSSDDNNYDQGRYSRYDRYCEEGSGKRSTREKSGPRRSDRNESYKSNARSQRRYPDIEDDCECCDSYSPKRGKENMNDYMGCGCSSESDDYSKKVSCRGSPTRRAESPPKVPKCKDYKEFDCSRPATRTHSPCRQSKRADVYESECGCSSIAPKRYDNKPSSPRKQDYKSKREDVYNSECDCFCSGDEKKQRNERKSPPRCSPPRYKNDQREQKNENSQYLDSRPEKTTCRRYPDTSQNRTPQTEENNAAKESAFEYCQCECKCVEDTNGTPNGTTKTKLDQAEDVCTCNCGPLSNPYEPQVTQSPKRNPAGDGTPFDDTVGIEALKLPTDSANKPWQAAYKVNIDLPFPEETKLAQAPVDNVPHPSKKKKPRPGSVGPSKKGSSKPKSRAASPTRNSAPSKTHPVETAKKRTTSLSNGRRHAQGGAKRTTDTSAAANSKLLNDINSASYFICKLQDDDNTQQYLIVVPKEPIARCDTPWDDPGQGSWKQLHCQRQFSDFQGVSWVNPASNSVFASPPFHQMEEVSEISSFEMPPGMTDTTMSIVKEYLQQTKMAGLPGLVQSIQPVIPHRKILTTVLAGPKRCHPIDQPSNKPNAAILTENRTVLRMNPLQNTSLAEDKSDVIVLLPPVAGFRPSRNSFDTDAVEVQRIMVRSSDSDVNPRSNPTKPLPPRPPKKPKRKALL